MHRRTLLALGTAVGLSACSVKLDSPVIRGTPAPPYTPPPPTPYPGTTELVPLERAACVALVSAAGAPGADAASLGKLAGVRAAHLAVLAEPDPFWRRQGASPAAPPTAAPAASKEAGQAAAATALTTLREAAVAKAIAAEGVPAAFWAALGASAEQARLWLAAPVGTVAPAVSGRVVAVREDAAALDQLIARYHEAVFGFSSLVGFLPNNHALRPTIVAMLTAARTRRDSLVAYDRAASASPTPGAGVYGMAPVAADKVPAAAGSLLAAVTQAAGTWVASCSTERRARAVTELVYAAGAGLPVGSGLAEWPGWPDQS